MMTIKFRAWDKREKKMDVVYNLNWLGKKQGWEVNSEGDQDNFELMQFTGLKDRFDKEIYEGDLVQLKQKKYYNEGKPYVVKWKTLKLYNGWNVSSGANLVVVGNVYEGKHELSE